MNYFARVFILSFMYLSACGEDAGGLRATVDTGGPKVVWDITHKPLPEIPLPNDAAT
ncbi:MAG: hypothetical protein FJ088_08005, partial [Deltaproteobacteria bacterium]|nr:hypothetical protein [Deltaproteobacteria bacterium]